MQLFLTAFAEVDDPRADNARHDLTELLIVAFVAVLCGASGLRRLPNPLLLAAGAVAAWGTARGHGGLQRGDVGLERVDGGVVQELGHRRPTLPAPAIPLPT